MKSTRSTISYVPAIALPAGESKHDPISLIEPGVPVIFVARRDSTRKTIFGNMMEMKARCVTIISVIEEETREIKEISDEFIEMPSPFELVNSEEARSTCSWSPPLSRLWL